MTTTQTASTESKPADARATAAPVESVVVLHPLHAAMGHSYARGFGASGPCDAPRTSRAHRLASFHRNFGNQAVLRSLSAAGPTIQTKLTINQPRDQYEQEADRVTEQLMRMPDPKSADMTGFGSLQVVQRKCACGGTCADCQKPDYDDEHAHVQMKAAGPVAAGGIEAPPIVHEVLNLPGQPLDEQTRVFMESRFGQDFRGVRVHADEKAAESAGAVGARAYTVGKNIVFGGGEFAPRSTEGQRLLGHELTHVVQQWGSKGTLASHGNDKHEVMRAPQTGTTLDVSPALKMSQEEARTVLADYVSTAGVDDTIAAMNAFSATLRIPFTLENSARRLRLLVAACSLLDAKGAGTLLASITNPANADQKHLKDRFGMLDRRFREALVEILRRRASVETEPKPEQEDVRWTEGNEGEFAFIPKPGMTLNHIAAYVTGYPAAPDDLAALNDLSRTAPIPPGQAIRIPVDYIDSNSRAFREMSGAMRNRIALAQRDVSGKKALARFQNVRPGPGIGLIPITTAAAKAAAQVALRPLEALARFIECLLKSLSGEGFLDLKGRIGLKLAVAISTSFGPGVLVGATKEILRIATQIASTIRHPIKFIDDMLNFVGLLFSPEASEFGCAMGEDIGEALNKEIAALAPLGNFEFAYELGKIAGPMLLNTLVAFIAPEIMIGLRDTRIGKRLLVFLEKMGGKLSFLNKWRKQSKRAAVAVEKDTVAAEMGERAIADADRFLEEHPPGKIDGVVGERHAPLTEGGEGHVVREEFDADAPGSIGCVIESKPRKLRRGCPEGMGARAATEAELEKFKAEHKVEVQKGPVPDVTGSEKMSVPEAPPPQVVLEDLPHSKSRDPKQVGIEPGEAHHIATIYRDFGKRNKVVFERAGLNINREENLIKEFMEHAQSRGWYKKQGKKFIYKRGHHEAYHEFVTKYLERHIPEGLPLDQAALELTRVLEELSGIIQAHPDVLQYGTEALVNTLWWHKLDL